MKSKNIIKSSPVSRSVTIKQFKENYKVVKEILKNYSIYKNRLKFSNMFDENKKSYWSWYTFEIDFVFKGLSLIEEKLLKDHFLKQMQKEDMFFSNTKYYLWMNIACKNFLKNLDITFFETKKPILTNDVK